MVSVSLLFDLLLLVLLAAAVVRSFRCPDCGKFLREGHHCDVIDLGCADSAIQRLVPHADVTSLSYILESLTNRLTVEEAEAKHAVRDKRLGKKPVPFGFRHKNWQVLVSQMQGGDELWEYSFYVGPLHAEAGMAVIRNGEVVATLVTIRS